MLDSRQEPTADFIANMQQKFPVEPEIDRVLTRKMKNRAGAPYSPVSLESMAEHLTAFLGGKLDKPFAVKNLHWMTGGSSKLQLSFDLNWHGQNGGEAPHDSAMILRMSPAESIVETSRRREFEMIAALAPCLPVPICYWEDEDANSFPYPALIFSRADGVVKPASDDSEQVTGLGINYGPKLRPAVTKAFMRGLSAMHNAGIASMHLPSFEIPAIGSNIGPLKQVATWRRIWEEDRGEEEPLMQLAAGWLEDNAPPIDHLSVIHGDCRSGNFLIDGNNGDITAWLDWELCLIGDRHQDLTWATSLAYAHMAENGETLLINGMLPIDEFFAAYETATGLTVDPARLRYYSVYNAWVAAIVCTATAYRAARGSKTHQDIVLTWLNGIGGMLMAQLHHAMMEAFA